MANSSIATGGRHNYRVIKGTAQGAVVSPIMANLFLHYCMDEWLRLNYPNCPFERYADDSVIHCRTKAEADKLKDHLSERLKECGLEMHPGKTKIVYCKGGSRKEDYPDIQFDFLGYSSKPRSSIVVRKTLSDCGLQMHALKTKLLLCKDSNRKIFKNYPNVSFGFLGFTFKPRIAQNSIRREWFTNFLPAVSRKAIKAMNEKMREWKC